VINGRKFDNYVDWIAPAVLITLASLPAASAPALRLSWRRIHAAKPRRHHRARDGAALRGGERPQAVPSGDVVHPQVDADYVARMEDVLDLYAEAPDPQRPVVCFDKRPIQLIGEVRQPVPREPGQIERYDCEYRRNGTANLFVFLNVNRPGAR
jgi:hypothetical protein